MARQNDYPNETSNTIAGITTPADQQNIAATDSLKDFVQEVMDNLQEEMGLDDPQEDKKRDE